MYSAVDRLLWVRDVLDGTPEMSTLLGSCFGGLFQIHVCRLYSGKVVHSMMTRQLVTKKKSWDCRVASSKKAIALTTKFRESFLWTISTLKPHAKLMGKWKDPIGVFCKKLRQQTVKTCGFPLALQLVAFQAIPQLLKLMGGDDSVNLLNYPEKAFPQHVGVTLAAVQKGEHDPELTVIPMMDISGEREEGWTLFL
ncbi:hypothetical protein F2Q68_00037242 [Brassica cretica]|uniref:Uncharacterized protein n=1 Tax=Brassica cretica TaxID=69181 RepID=A0A8S9GZF2_BRACR|nr:hypothetical protein F2Q68_00037242 [Brassica cretica]